MVWSSGRWIGAKKKICTWPARCRLWDWWIFKKNLYLYRWTLQMLIECTCSSAESTRTGAICTSTGAICTCRVLLHVIECILHRYRCNLHLHLHIAPPSTQSLRIWVEGGAICNWSMKTRLKSILTIQSKRSFFWPDFLAQNCSAERLTNFFFWSQVNYYCKELFCWQPFRWHLNLHCRCNRPVGEHLRWRWCNMQLQVPIAPVRVQYALNHVQ